MGFPSPELLDEIRAALKHKPEALAFLYSYGMLVEHIDDAIDEPKNIETVEKLTGLAQDIYSSNYWRQNADYLRIIDKLIHREYFDSVQWEQSDHEWQRRDARCMSHCGYNMLFAMLALEAGPEVLRKISLRFREQSHVHHIRDSIDKVQFNGETAADATMLEPSIKKD